MKLLVRLPSQKRTDADPADAAWRRPGLVIEFSRDEGVLHVGTTKIDLRRFIKDRLKPPDND